jgi:CHAD domain-containing protein
MLNVGEVPLDGTGDGVERQRSGQPAPPSPVRQHDTPNMPEFARLTAVEAAGRIMLEQWRRVLAHEDGARSGADPEDVHKMRVAIRRLRAAERLFRKHLDSSPAGQALGALRIDVRQLASALGSVRDLDVAVERLDRWAEGAPPADHAALQRLRQGRIAERAAAREALHGFLDGEVMARLRRELGPALGAATQAPAAVGRRASRRRSMRRQGPRQLAQALRRLRRQIGGVVAPTTDALHATRIAAKRFRYTAEFLVPLYGDALSPVITVATGIQDALGTVHDADVATPALLGEIEALASGAAYAADAGAVARLLGAYRADRERELARFGELWPQVPRPKQLPRAVER